MTRKELVFDLTQVRPWSILTVDDTSNLDKLWFTIGELENGFYNVSRYYSNNSPVAHDDTGILVLGLSKDKANAVASQVPGCTVEFNSEDHQAKEIDFDQSDFSWDGQWIYLPDPDELIGFSMIPSTKVVNETLLAIPV